MFALWSYRSKGFLLKKNNYYLHKYINEKNDVFMVIKSFKEFIGESFERGYGLNLTAINRSGEIFNETRLFDTIDEIRKFMNNWISTNGGYIKYFDICSGSNFSDSEFLEVWGGTDGYFYNVLNSTYKNRQQFTYSEIKNIKRSEIEVNSFLGIK